MLLNNAGLSLRKIQIYRYKNKNRFKRIGIKIYIEGIYFIGKKDPMISILNIYLIFITIQTD